MKDSSVSVSKTFNPTDKLETIITTNITLHPLPYELVSSTNTESTFKGGGVN